MGHWQTADPDQMSYDATSERDLHCLLTVCSTCIKKTKTPNTTKIDNKLVYLIGMENPLAIYGLTECIGCCGQ